MLERHRQDSSSSGPAPVHNRIHADLLGGTDYLIGEEMAMLDTKCIKYKIKPGHRQERVRRVARFQVRSAELIQVLAGR